MALTLRNFADIIRDEKGVDFEQYFLSMFINVNRTLDSKLSDYLEMISNDPANWIDTFPTKLRAPTALSKPKTAMLWALKSCDVVKNDYGVDMCVELHKKVDTAWKTNKDRISEQRLLLSNQRSNASPDLENEANGTDAVDASSQINSNGGELAISAVEDGQRENYIHVRELLAATHTIRSLKDEKEELEAVLDMTTKELNDMKMKSEKRLQVINTLRLAFNKLASMYYDKDDGTAEIHTSFIDALILDC